MLPLGLKYTDASVRQRRRAMMIWMLTIDTSPVELRRRMVYLSNLRSNRKDDKGIRERNLFRADANFLDRYIPQ